MTRIPSTQALRALESFARHGTVWQAADELNLTRSAVSHQLRLLESSLGFQLMSRVGARVELTPQGAAYALDVRRALSTIAGSAARHAGRGATGVLTVSCPPGLASSWLCPKIGRFHDDFPDVALSLVTPRRLDDVSNPDVDLFITFGHGNLPGQDIELLQEVAFTPLCSPLLVDKLDGLSRPGDLLAANLLHLADFDDWQMWFRQTRLPEDAARTGVVFSDMNLVYSAAIATQGVAMGDRFICHEAIRQGQLVQPFEQSIPSPRSYYMVLPPEKSDNAAVVAFRGWLRDQLQSQAT
ncbi:LysR substrate-binding domain-containing protein [Paracoccus pacificus]|uniref:LysR substrate-binding domain-containing protein n=1 Tax=Paracoccus pacificus TaxID=1463598 RepID=A0ABW4R2P9_9RHOB